MVSVVEEGVQVSRNEWVRGEKAVAVGRIVGKPKGGFCGGLRVCVYDWAENGNGRERGWS